MGRGSSKVGNSSGGGGNSLLSRLTDNTDFNTWVRENMSDELKQYRKDHGMEAIRELWRERRRETELENVHEIPIEDAIAQVRENMSTATLDGWFRNADSEYKPVIVEGILGNEGMLNAGLNIAYYNYSNLTSNPVSFDTWLNTPQTMYRGDRGQATVGGDIFLSYSTDRRVAEGFGSNVSSISIRPIDTWGSYQTTGEQEYLVPISEVRRRR